MRIQQIEAEFDLKMRELEFVISERVVEDAIMEIEMAKLNASVAQRALSARKGGRSVDRVRQQTTRLLAMASRSCDSLLSLD